MFCDQTCFMSKDLSVILYEQIKSKEKRLGKLFLRATETRFLDEIPIENLSEGALPSFSPTLSLYNTFAMNTKLPLGCLIFRFSDCLFGIEAAKKAKIAQL